MDIIGNWILCEVMSRDKDFNILWTPLADFLADPEADEDLKRGLDGTRITVTEGGELLTMQKIPEGATQEQIDEAVKRGRITLSEDGMMIVGRTEWKERDGKLVFDTHIEGEILGEKADPWEELVFTDDGMLEMMVYRYKKEN